MVDLLVNQENVDNLLDKSNQVSMQNDDLIEKVSKLLKSQHKQIILETQIILSSNLFWNYLIAKFNFNQILISSDQYLIYKFLDKIDSLVAYMNQIEHKLINMEQYKFIYADDPEYLLNIILFLYDESLLSSDNSNETLISYLFNNFVLKHDIHYQHDINNNPNLKIDQHTSEFSLYLPLDVNELLLNTDLNENTSNGNNIINGFIPLVNNLKTLCYKTYDHFLAAEEHAALSGMHINYTTFACFCSSYYGLGHAEPTTYFDSPFLGLYERKSFNEEIKALFKDDCYFDDWKVKLGSFAFDDVFQSLSDQEQQLIRKHDQLWVPLVPETSCWDSMTESRSAHDKIVVSKVESSKKSNGVCGVTAQISSKHWTVAPKLISSCKKQTNLSPHNNNLSNNCIIGENGWNKSQLDPIGTKPASMLPRKNKLFQQLDNSKVKFDQKSTNPWYNQNNLSIAAPNLSIQDHKLQNKKFKFYTPSSVLESFCEKQAKQISLKQQQQQQQISKTAHETAYHPQKSRQPGPRYFYQQQQHNYSYDNNNNNYNGYYNGKRKSYFGKHNHYNEIESRQKQGSNQYYYRKNRN